MPGLLKSLDTFYIINQFTHMQLLFGPMKCRGIGLSDGEVMEHLWSYLTRFNRMTKEMRPAHRTEILAHALILWNEEERETQ